MTNEKVVRPPGLVLKAIKSVGQAEINVIADQISKIIKDVILAEWEFSKLFNSLSAKPTKWSKHTQIICRLLPTNYLNVFGHFVGLALKGLTIAKEKETPQIDKTIRDSH